MTPRDDDHRHPDAAGWDRDVSSFPDQGDGSEVDSNPRGHTYRPYGPPRLHVKVTGSFSGSSDVAGTKYGWTEVTCNADTGVWDTMDGCRSSVDLDIPLVEANGEAITTNKVVEAELDPSGLYYRCWREAATGTTLALVRVTSATPDALNGGSYPAAVDTWPSSVGAGGITNGTDGSVRLFLTNADAPVVGNRYLAQFLWSFSASPNYPAYFQTDPADASFNQKGTVNATTNQVLGKGNKLLKNAADDRVLNLLVGDSALTSPPSGHRSEGFLYSTLPYKSGGSAVGGGVVWDNGLTGGSLEGHYRFIMYDAGGFVCVALDLKNGFVHFLKGASTYADILANIGYFNTTRADLAGGSGHLTRSGGIDYFMPYWVSPPAAYSSAGAANQIAQDGTYFYFHNGTRWYRVAMDTTLW